MCATNSFRAKLAEQTPVYASDLFEEPTDKDSYLMASSNLVSISICLILALPQVLIQACVLSESLVKACSTPREAG